MSAPQIFPERAREGLAVLMPGNAFAESVGTWVWTSPTGSWRLGFEGFHPTRRAVFADLSGGWHVKVPLTHAGLDSLVVVMVCAGALAPPAWPGARTFMTAGDEQFSAAVEALLTLVGTGRRWEARR